MKLINGKEIAEKIKFELKQRIEAENLKPRFAIIYAGFNDASQIYVDKKMQYAKEIGIECELIRLKETSTEELTTVVENLNQNKEIDGYIIQLPLPKNIDTKFVLSKISPSKDIDGLSPVSLGLLHHNLQSFTSATALAVMEAIKYVARYEDNQYTEAERKDLFGEQLKTYLPGKNILIINHSILVGKPLNAILLNYNATVTVANKFTRKEYLDALINTNDIVISAAGSPGIVTVDQIHEGQILIDVGINKSALGIQGDIDPKGMENKNIWLTPVPDGVGPMTVTMLLKNVYLAAKKV